MSADETLADLHRLIIQHFGWDDAHNYFFSQGCDRYEDPLLFATQDRVSARCRRIYCAADVPLSRVFSRPEAPLYYTLRAAEWPRTENRPRRHRRLEAIRLNRPAASRRAAAPTLPCA
ncbi:MAG: IS1096 element passenger TnpR family protein [Adlercreutzia equolifaciens]